MRLFGPRIPKCGMHTAEWGLQLGRVVQKPPQRFQRKPPMRFDVLLDFITDHLLKRDCDEVAYITQSRSGSTFCSFIPSRVQFRSSCLLVFRIFPHVHVYLAAILPFFDFSLEYDTWCSMIDCRMFSGSECEDTRARRKVVDRIISFDNLVEWLEGESEGSAV